MGNAEYMGDPQSRRDSYVDNGGEENDKEIISLIGCYIPVYRDCPDHAIEMMNKISPGWTERKKKFIEAISFARCGEIEKELESESVELLSEILYNEILSR